MPHETAAERASIESRRVERVYAAISRVYDGAFDWALGPGRRRAIERLAPRDGERVLEVGVGTGLSLLQYPQGCHVTGVDISEPMLEQARDRATSLGRDGVDLRLMDARKLQFPTGMFDRVLAPYVISVVPEPQRVMDEIRRVCRPGGTVVVVNHFVSRHRAMAWFERVATPLSQWIGFRLDLPIETVLAVDGLEPVHVERVNLLGHWRLVELRRANGAV